MLKRIFCVFLIAILMAAVAGGWGGMVWAAGPYIVQIAAGHQFSMALMSNGDLYAWGYNHYGQIGDGTVGGNVLSPKLIGTGFTDIAAGGYHALALKHTELYTWGQGSFGQLGDGEIATPDGYRAFPMMIGTGFTRIAAGSQHSMALKGGDLYTWGNNSSGQLGDGKAYARSNAPKLIGSGFTQIAAGGGGWDFSMALKGSALYAWGNNSHNQLGDGTAVDRYSPTYIGTGFTNIFSGHGSSFALKKMDLYAWGARGYTLGTGTSSARSAPALIGTGYTDVAIGGSHTLALKGSALYAWGENDSGQIGNGTIGSGEKDPNYRKLVPVSIGSGYTQIAAGAAHSLALKDGVLYAWGNNNAGQLGDRTTINRGAPVSVVFPGMAPSPSPTPSPTATLPANKLTGVAIMSAAGEITSTSMVVGQSLGLGLAVKPDNASGAEFVWSSSNNSVVGFKLGGLGITEIIVAKSAGTAVITVICVSDPSVKAECAVTVTDAAAPTPTPTTTPTNTPELKAPPVSSVTLGFDSVTLEVGKNATLTATVSPPNAGNKNVTWKSSDTKIATVDAGGVVRGVAQGSATITVTTDDGGKTAKCKVTVVSPVTSIEAAQTSVYLKKGASAALSVAAITPDGSKAILTWKTSNKSVVSVDKNGKVKALKAGTATITAEADNGKSIKITVSVGGKAPVSVSASNVPAAFSMNTGDTLKLNVSVKPSNAQGVITFKSGNTNILTVNEAGRLNAIKKGTAKITITLGSKKAVLTVTVN